MPLLDSNTFGEKIYNKFPSKYKLDDASNNYALKRFIFTASEGGYKYVIDDINGLLRLISPDTASLDELYLLYEHYGMEVFQGIPEEYLRRLLPFLHDATSYKGSLSSIDYISTSVTGLPVETTIEANDGDNSVDVVVSLNLTSVASQFFPDYGQFIRILKNFIPFYCVLYVVYNYMYTSDEDAFHLFVGHAIKNICTLYPTDIGEIDDPIAGHIFYSSQEGVLATESDLIIIE